MSWYLCEGELEGVLMVLVFLDRLRLSRHYAGFRGLGDNTFTWQCHHDRYEEREIRWAKKEWDWSVYESFFASLMQYLKRVQPLRDRPTVHKTTMAGQRYSEYNEGINLLVLPHIPDLPLVKITYLSLHARRVAL